MSRDSLSRDACSAAVVGGWTAGPPRVPVGPAGVHVLQEARLPLCVPGPPGWLTWSLMGCVRVSGWR